MMTAMNRIPWMDFMSSLFFESSVDTNSFQFFTSENDDKKVLPSKNNNRSYTVKLCNDN